MGVRHGEASEYVGWRKSTAASDEELLAKTESWIHLEDGQVVQREPSSHRPSPAIRAACG